MAKAVAEKITVIVPAYNEAEQFAKGRQNGYFEALRQWSQQDGKNRNVVFVNDGSKDKTEEIVRQEGFEVIPSDTSGENKGKGHAAIAGFKHARNELGSSIAVLLDADITNLSSNLIEKLVEPLEKPDSKVKMSVGSYAEFESSGRLKTYLQSDINSSGQRAIRLSAISSLFAQNPIRQQLKETKFKALMEGFGLEHSLNALIPEKEAASVLFHCERPYRKLPSDKQSEQIRASRKKLQERKDLINWLNGRRKAARAFEKPDRRKEELGKVRRALKLKQAVNPHLK
ncbi:glycosyltransferase [Candidatus Micrarchaeota archaeon]|nr:glycosyltransferase [Candidatus Micrarchaeota archaeon]